MTNHSTVRDTTHINALIGGIPVALVASIDAAGRPRSRPMISLDLPVESAIWLVSPSLSTLADDIKRNQAVHVTYADANVGRYVLVSGLAEIRNDSSLLSDLWNSSLDVWFPKGASDPDLVLIRIAITAVEFWDNETRRFIDVPGYGIEPSKTQS